MSGDVTCPFCGRDPFHYVDNGVGMEAVAVTCCELGNEYFRGARDAPEEVTLSWEEFCEIGRRLLSSSAAERAVVEALEARLALAPIASLIEGHDQMKPIIDPDIPMEEADEHDIRLAQEIAAEVGREGRLEHADAMDRVIVQASRYDRATVVNVELLAALKGVLHAYSMGPLDCAALYGPDADLRQIERNATARANDAIEKASIAGVKS